MASQKTRLLKALKNRQAAIAKHHADTIRRAGLAATAAELAAGAAASASVPPGTTAPPAQKGKPR